MQMEDASVDSARVRTALAWAVKVATTEPEALGSPPERPSPAEWRSISGEEFRSYVDELLLGRHTDKGLDGLHRLGALDVWIPEVAAMVGFGDGEWRHKDVWLHTKQVVWQSVPRLSVRWGALLHDIGKPKTRSIDAKGEVHFFGHAEVGASMFRKRLAERLAFAPELSDRIHFLILYHLRASQYEGQWTDSAVRRFAKEVGDGLTDLLDLSRADITTKRPGKKKRGLRQVSALGARIRELAKLDAKVVPLPKGLGTLIAERFAVPPSKRLGEIRDELAALCDEGALESQRDAEYYLEYIAANRERFKL